MQCIVLDYSLWPLPSNASSWVRKTDISQTNTEDDAIRVDTESFTSGLGSGRASCRRGDWAEIRKMSKD